MRLQKIIFSIFLFFTSISFASVQIWEDRGSIDKLDLTWGSGSPERAPVAPFTFIAEDLAATNPKVKVTDAKGAKWAVKWDEEVPGEVAATRLAWAAGLTVEETYYVKTGVINFGGQRPSLQRAGSFIDNRGSFKKPARFERRQEDWINKGIWSFDKVPAFSTHGLAVTILMNTIMANWDAKSDNNKIVTRGGVDWYMVGDYGACFGKMGGWGSHSKYKLNDYLKNPPVVTSVNGNEVTLAYDGKGKNHDSVSLADARLFANKMKDLTLAQIESAFLVSSPNPVEAKGFAKATYDRIQQIVTAVK